MSKFQYTRKQVAFLIGTVIFWGGANLALPESRFLVPDGYNAIVTTHNNLLPPKICQPGIRFKIPRLQHVSLVSIQPIQTLVSPNLITNIGRIKFLLRLDSRPKVDSLLPLFYQAGPFHQDILPFLSDDSIRDLSTKFSGEQFLSDDNVIRNQINNSLQQTMKDVCLNHYIILDKCHVESITKCNEQLYNGDNLLSDFDIDDL